jgi:hypothetical protein
MAHLENERMIELHDMVTLDQAAGELGMTAIALFARAAKGIIWAGVVGETWVTTRTEIERYQREQLPPIGPR